MNIGNSEALPTKIIITPIREDEEEEREEEEEEDWNGETEIGAEVAEGEGEGEVGETAENRPSRPSSKTSSRKASPRPEASETVSQDGSIDGSIDGKKAIDETPAADETELSLRVQRVVTEVVRRKKRENPFPLSSVHDEGWCEGYDTTAVRFVCAPLSVGPIEQKFNVRFEGVKEDWVKTTDGEEDPALEETSEKIVKRERILTVKCTGEEVPVYVAEEMLDMKCCLMGRVYRRKVVLKNRGTAAYRVMVKVPAEHQDFIEVNPTMFFVQAQGSQSINVRFTPDGDVFGYGTHSALDKVDILKTLGYFTVPYDEFPGSALLNLPVEIQVVNQEIPVYFTLKAQVTPSALSLSTRMLDFGEIYTGQRSSKVVTVKNTSMLPQKVAFCRLRKGFSVSVCLICLIVQYDEMNSRLSCMYMSYYHHISLSHTHTHIHTHIHTYIHT